MERNFQREGTAHVKVSRHESAWHNPEPKGGPGEQREERRLAFSEVLTTLNHRPSVFLSLPTSEGLESISLLSVSSAEQDTWHSTSIQQVPVGCTVPSHAGEPLLSLPVAPPQKPVPSQLA